MQHHWLHGASVDVGLWMSILLNQLHSLGTTHADRLPVCCFAAVLPPQIVRSVYTTRAMLLPPSPTPALFHAL